MFHEPATRGHRSEGVKGAPRGQCAMLRRMATLRNLRRIEMNIGSSFLRALLIVRKSLSADRRGIARLTTPQSLLDKALKRSVF